MTETMKRRLQYWANRDKNPTPEEIVNAMYPENQIQVPSDFFDQMPRTHEQALLIAHDVRLKQADIDYNGG